MNVLLTGATGFVGRALMTKIEAISDIRLTVAARMLQSASESTKQYVIKDLSGLTDWSFALVGQQVVIHTAARAHLMKGASVDPLAVFRLVNVDGTLNLARQAALAGVKRFIFISSIKVNGEGTQIGWPYTTYDIPAPEDAYGLSKEEAEAGLKLLALETGMEVVIIRPPLVYGPGVKGNFASILRWLQRGVPLPLGGVTCNRRSLVALDNLVDLLMTCIDHPAAVNETFLVSDGVDLSTADLLRRLGNALGKPARLLSVPPVLLHAVGKLLGQADKAQRLLGNLQVDISHTCQTLSWKPPISVDEGFRRTVQGLNQ